MNKPVPKGLISQGFKEAEKITKEFAKTFYFASRFLPRNKRNASYAVYAICRISDDAIDNNIASLGLKQINKIKENIDAVYNNRHIHTNLLLAFKYAVETYGIPKIYFQELLEGMNMDFHKTRYENFDELYNYCYYVAGVVSLIMLKIFGYHNQEVQEHAIELGVAMQLTNILRDIKEDYRRGRIYLPRDEMKRFNIIESHIANEKVDKNFIDFLKFQIERAKKYYRNSQKGLKLIDHRSSRFVISTMRDMYAGILTSIEQSNYNVFIKRAHISTFEKIKIVLKTFIKGEYLWK